jgi:hypothetical protein
MNWIKRLRNYIKQERMRTLRRAALLSYARGDYDSFNLFIAKYEELERGQ